MAHHQRYGADHLSASPLSMLSSSATAAATSKSMPSISEDDLLADGDEPPERHNLDMFRKMAPVGSGRKESLITKALHTDSDSHDNDNFHDYLRQASRSSTCSTYSGRSALTSEDGLTSPGTRASSPCSPPRSLWFTKPASTKAPSKKSSREKMELQRPATVSASESSEPVVEAQLGRKRAISFFCGGNKKDNKDAKKSPSPSAKPAAKESQETPAADPPKRACTIQFACPSKIFSKNLENDKKPNVYRRRSPPPRSTPTLSPSPHSRPSQHRDSDSTIKSDTSIGDASTKTTKPDNISLPLPPTSEPERGETSGMNDFATSEDDNEEWTHESTVPKCRLTVDDTLEKESALRKIGEEVENEAIEEEDEAAMNDELDMSDDDISDGGFQTDDEDGFAESDDEDDDSDYEWWTPRRPSVVEPGTLLPAEVQRPDAERRPSDSSINSALHNPRSRYSKSPAPVRPGRRSGNVQIRPDSPEMPDSTDFVCGTLDEDKPLEDAYIQHLEARRAAKHRVKPQDIDPTFPQSDPEADSDDNEEEEENFLFRKGDESDNHLFPHGSLESFQEPPRGRTLTVDTRKRSPIPSPLPQQVCPSEPSTAKRVTSSQRLHSPPPPSSILNLKAQTKSHKTSPPPSQAPTSAPAKKCANQHRSPPPPACGAHRSLFGRSPHPRRSPAPKGRLTSPPPSRRTSPSGGTKPISFASGVLARRPSPFYTTSLPRSPPPFMRRVHTYAVDDEMDDEIEEDTATPRQPTRRVSIDKGVDNMDDDDDVEEDEGAETDPVAMTDVHRAAPGYSRGAIDIVQGLERKRLKRREKFYEKYNRKCDRKHARGEVKRPQPGKGAQRMRQVGLECAVYKGQRMLSV